ncbi:hypothetical protein LUZ60_000433 [Juncus effusus]|nr:hypothetical protein LUZ60_000433 [Juncus effusus]
MPSQRDSFQASGPVHLTSIDWNNPNHQRSIAASLVQGVYVLERDRQQNRVGSELLGPAWFKSFNFNPIQILTDESDSSIFGCVYQLTLTSPDPLAFNAPTFVIAFRGTITKKESFSRDLELDFQVLRNGLDKTSRFKAGFEALNYLVFTYGHQRIWLAGHSLGSAMAILAAKNMAKVGVYIKSFLFNPPFLSAPIEIIKDQKIKHGIRIANSFMTAGVAKVLKKHSENNHEIFEMIKLWVPNLYVNKGDNICSEYLGYFEHRKKMEQIGAKNVGKIATKNSVKDLIFNVFGNESEPLHLFPSAVLHVNWGDNRDFKSAHGIHQWWKPDLNLDSRDYRYL